MSYRILASVLVLCFSGAAMGQAPASVPAASQSTPKTVATDRDTALQLGDQTYHFVAHIQRLTGSTGHGEMDETTEWWELRAPNGAVVQRQSYQVTPGENGFDWSTQVSARVFTTKSGSGVLVEGGEEPSAPSAGGWVQVFGFKWGPTKASVLTSFGAPISTDGELLDIATDPRRQTPSIPGRTVIPLNDILRFRVSTGNFAIIYPVLINWITGRVQPSWHCLRMTTHGQVDRCNYLVEAEVQPRQARTFARLFSEPDETFMPGHVVIEPGSKVEILEAEVPIDWGEDEKNIVISVAPDADTWIKVRIDGREGWIHTQEDFAAIGLPQAG